MTRPEWLIEMPYAEYHAARATHMTSHALADFRKSPRNYRLRQLGALQAIDSPAFAAGRAFHTMMESPDLFAATYTVADGPVNPKTGQCYGNTTKAYADWLAATPGPLVSTEDAAKYRAMRDSALAHDAVRSVMDCEHYHEGVVRNRLSGLPVQSRIDLCLPEYDIIIDWKSCADIDRFERQAVYDYGYIEQMAFYSLATGWATAQCYIVAVQSSAPYTCGVWKIDEDSLAVAGSLILDTITEYQECCDLDNWPTGYEQTRVLSR